MTDWYDAIIVGAGHNGLVCASYLAKAGCRVAVLEAREKVGGMADEASIGDDFRLPGIAHWSYPLPAIILDELELEKFGLKSGEALHTIALARDGNHLTLKKDEVTGARLTDADRQAYTEFKRRYRRYSDVLTPFNVHKPPRFHRLDTRDKLALAKAGYKLRFGLGKDEMREFLRVAAINIYDVLNEQFTDEALKGAIAFDACLGHKMGPRTPGTVLNYLLRIAGEAHGEMVQVRAGRTRVTDALLDCAKDAGARILTDTPVSRILVEDGAAAGIETELGVVIKTGTVISNADARTTFLDLVGARHLDAMFAHRVSRIRGEGTVAKLHIALDGLPSLEGLGESALRSRLIIAPGMDYIERAFNPAKYGRFSESPVLEILIPSLLDASLAPEGSHVVSVSASYAPCDLAGGWEQQRASFAYRIIALIEQFVPGFKSHVIDHRLMTPKDIEQEFHCRGGHWHHCETSIHQSLMMRPVYGAAQYDTPVKGLYLCGASAHPGGGITGLPGHNAAHRVIRKGLSTW